MKKLPLFFSFLLIFFVRCALGAQNCNEFQYPSCWYNGFTFGADWLYWETSQTQMEIGSNVTILGNVSSDVLRPQFEYRTGYRIFIDYEFCNSNWVLSGTYTHLPTKASVSAFNNPADIATHFVQLFSENFQLLSGLAEATFSSVVAQWHTNLNYFDLDLSKTFALCRVVEFVPTIGLKGLWLSEQLEINGSTPLNGGGVFNALFKERFKGVGVKCALAARLYLRWHFSLIGSCGYSLLYTNVNNRGDLNTVTAGFPPLISYHDKLRKSMPTIDTFIGLAYCAPLKRCPTTLHIGWEHHRIFDTNQFTFDGSGDLGLQGVTLGGSISF